MDWNNEEGGSSGFEPIGNMHGIHRWFGEGDGIVQVVWVCVGLGVVQYIVLASWGLLVVKEMLHWLM